MDKAYVHENEGMDEVSFDIRVPCAEGEDQTIVRCWDYFLAEHICKSVNEYLGEGSTIVHGEDCDCDCGCD